MYLLDTCVVSQFNPNRKPLVAELADWFRHNGQLCSLSVISLMEIRHGIDQLRHRGATARAARLAAWCDELLREHADRLISVDAAVALRVGELLAIARSNGVDPGGEDALIAATADIHRLELLTFNRVHFQPMRIAARAPIP